MADNLWAISIDPDESMREYVLLQLKVKAMRDLLFRSRIFTYLAAATPGPQGAGHDRQDLGAGARRAQGPATAEPLRPRRSSTRPRPGTGSASCRRRARSPTSPGSARSASRRRRSTRFIRDPRSHRGRDRRAARGDAGQRDGGARARPGRARSASASTAIFLQRPLPGALRRRRDRAASTARRAETPRAAVRAALRAARHREPPRLRPARAARPARGELPRRR